MQWNFMQEIAENLLSQGVGGAGGDTGYPQLPPPLYATVDTEEREEEGVATAQHQHIQGYTLTYISSGAIHPRRGVKRKFSSVSTNKFMMSP